MQAGGRRPEVSASRQLSEGAGKASERAGKKSARVARVSYRGYVRGGGGGRVQPACSCLLALPLFSPAARCRAPFCSYGPRAPPWPVDRATGAAATHHPSDPVGRGHNPSCLLGRARGELAGPQL